MKLKYVALAVVLVIAGAFIAVRIHSLYRGSAGHMFERRMAILAWRLHLTSAQREKIKSMMRADLSSAQPLLRELTSGQEQMLAATQNGSFDEAKVRSIAERQSQTIAQLIVIKERFLAQVYSNVLTPEQRTKADAIRRQSAHRINQHLQGPVAIDWKDSIMKLTDETTASDPSMRLSPELSLPIHSCGDWN
jgi:Spy/CpxP family protein refolding chaperone